MTDQPMSERVTEDIAALLREAVQRLGWLDGTNVEFRERCNRALAARPASAELAMDVLRCIPADWKPGYGREWGNLGPILAEFIDDLREGRYPAPPASAEPVAWAIREADGKWTSGNTYRTEERASRMVRALTSEGAHGLRVFPLYTTPPAAAP